ncbi:DUF2976 domain-containing protein [Vibrio owensii]|uniref:DUF2976 domain-containing protein n=1 Tax=Vibrio owensii TaxID=696485 RepID=UPI0018F200A6|nr:DUF2976 domain-containing protein [Vibrio owensii]
MLNKFKKSVALSSALISGVAVAALPKVENEAAKSGNYLGMLTGLFGDAYNAAQILIGGSVFLVVVIAVIIAFWQYHQGKRDLSDVGVVAAAGGLVMTLVFILLQSGAGVVS